MMQKKTGGIIASRIAGQIGRDIETARLKRHWTRAVLARRAMMSEQTLAKIISGDTGVSLGRLIQLLAVLGADKRMENIIAPENDPVGMMLDEQRLPKRIRETQHER